jgi:hypothetical protein
LPTSLPATAPSRFDNVRDGAFANLDQITQMRCVGFVVDVADGSLFEELAVLRVLDPTRDFNPAGLGRFVARDHTLQQTSFVSFDRGGFGGFGFRVHYFFTVFLAAWVAWVA